MTAHAETCGLEIPSPQINSPGIPPAACPSRLRSLLRDLAGVLSMQMRYWGMDARGGNASLLVKTGLQRVARAGSAGEGSSRYRQPWRGGWIELHSFCAGYYHPCREGILFSRAGQRIFSAKPGGIPEPIAHRASADSSSPDAVLGLLDPFLNWLLDYESRVDSRAPVGYRDHCWKKLGGMRLGPHPSEIRSWLASLLRNPAATPRLPRRPDPRRQSCLRPSQPSFPLPKFHLNHHRQLHT